MILLKKLSFYGLLIFYENEKEREICQLPPNKCMATTPQKKTSVCFFWLAQPLFERILTYTQNFLKNFKNLDIVPEKGVLPKTVPGVLSNP